MNAQSAPTGWLEGQTAVVTGGAAGIGAAIVETFVAEGARVGILDRSEDALRVIREAHGDKVMTVAGTVTSWEDNVAIVENVVERFGKLDTFIGNAAIGDRNTPLAKIPPERISTAFRELYDVNVLGYLLGVKAALPALLASGGSVILTGSYSSFHPGGGGVLYVSSKHAIAGVIKQLAFELAPKVRVNGVAPGVAATSMSGLDTLEHAAGVPSVIPGVEQYIPLGEVPTTEDLTWPYVLLASAQRSRAITGSIISCDSGFAIRGLVQTAGGGDL
ncbi:MAG: 3-(cis-5,6-dihydroxycyclohexa-1,3-dien-1-yl)propanoate dehydrogenase [Actinobacteria bacterium]|nr:3-(cis-5,6-dihydroxycyclohexa-1,3-dien-1-yl)propanoate dehydrogenase [Actinomycetota bacterium]